MLFYNVQNSLKNFFEKEVFQILAKIEITRNKTRLFGRHFETVQYFFFIFIYLLIFLLEYSCD